MITEKLDNGEPNTLMEIVDEAYEMVNDRIDVLRECPKDVRSGEEMLFLKDLRSLLNLSENFRD